MLFKQIVRMSVLVFALGSASLADAEGKDLTLLFVQTSHGMKADAGEKMLRLVDVGKQTVYFSDRPNRVAGNIPLEQFVNGWGKGEDSFAENPPNAVLSVYDDEGEENQLIVVELFSPAVDGSDLVYRYSIIDGDMPESGGAVGLFIDTFGPGGGVGRGFHGVGVGRRGPGVGGWAGTAVINECEDGNC